MDKPMHDWEVMLDYIAYAYRTSVHSSTFQTPYYALHGREANSILDLALDLPPEPYQTPTDYNSKLMELLRYAFLKKGKQNLKLGSSKEFNTTSERKLKTGECQIKNFWM